MLNSLLLKKLSPAGQRARLSVFIFHRVFSAPDELIADEPDATMFDRMLGWIADLFNVMPLDWAVSALRHGNLPERAAAITFDDGYEDNYSVALPILLRHNLPATFFIATGYMGGGCMWNDRIIEAVRRTNCQSLDLAAFGLGRHSMVTIRDRQAAMRSLVSAVKYRPGVERDQLSACVAEQARVPIPANLMMTPTQVRGLREAGMQVGAHTVSHPILAELATAEAREEMLGGKECLESLLGEPVTLFAYPNGQVGKDFTDEHAAIARQAGFAAAVTTNWGAADSSADLFQIPRFTPWDRTRLRFGLRMARNLARA